MMKGIGKILAILLMTIGVVSCATSSRRLRDDAERAVRAHGDCPRGCVLRSEVKRPDANMKGPAWVKWIVDVEIIQPDGTVQLSDEIKVIYDETGKMKAYLHGL